MEGVWGSEPVERFRVFGKALVNFLTHIFSWFEIKDLTETARLRILSMRWLLLWHLLRFMLITALAGTHMARDWDRLPEAVQIHRNLS
jgi:hypothetical protein